MGDEFTGVPQEDWQRTRSDARDALKLAFLAWLLAVALIVLLLRKGILSWDDFRLAPRA